MATIRIAYTRSGRGLERDADLLKGIIEGAGHKCDIYTFTQKSWRLSRLNYYWERFKYRLPVWISVRINRIQISTPVKFFVKRVDLTIHLEAISLSLISRSRYNWFIPNQEWFRSEHCQYLQFLNEIICKTHEAERIFKELHPKVTFVGFSGDYCNKCNKSLEKDFRRFLHVAGNNRKKGSAAVVLAWANHPEWPELILVINDRKRLPLVPSNVHVFENIEDSKMMALRERAGVVLAPSEVEGFGHVLLEGMAFRSVVVTTDAPPMNELVHPGHGITVPWSNKMKCNLGDQYFVSTESLEAAVSELLSKSDNELQQMADLAYKWTQQNYKEFINRFTANLEDIN